MVDAGVDVVNVVFEHDSKVKVILLEERGVSSDVFSNLPEDAALSGLGGAGAEELGATEPQGGDAVMLITFGLDVEFEGYVGTKEGGNGMAGSRWWSKEVGSLCRQMNAG
ncbi:hypothetical protein OIU85_006410 [Salix viminalis]|uniref:Uncharacterized protein n=1 Tax=Salix viminalis TaxID=40686 RepID=A0A9Q0PKU6_SALVM|nr:hypothetical protein OIU85_006410 [Salix viminalis]